MRSYGDACGITRALDVIGERWAVPVVRELLFGPRRYSDLAAALPGVSTNILVARLKSLTESGVVVRRRLPPPAAATVYELTSWGAALEPVLVALGRWAAHTPVDLDEQSFGASSFALSLRTTFDPDAASGVVQDVRLVMDEDVFDARISGGRFDIHRVTDGRDAPTTGPAARGRVRLHAAPKTLAALIHQGLDPETAIARGTLRIDGPPAAVETFAACFTLPDRPTEGSS